MEDPAGHVHLGAEADVIYAPAGGFFYSFVAEGSDPGDVFFRRVEGWEGGSTVEDVACVVVEVEGRRGGDCPMQ